MDGGSHNTWNAVLANLRDEIPHPTFQLWFSRTECREENDGSWNLIVPSVLARETLEALYLERIGDLLRDYLDKDVDLKVTVEENRAQEAQAPPNKGVLPGTADKIGLGDPSAANRIGTSRRPAYRPMVPMDPGFYSEITLKEDYTFENFITGPSNRMAHAASQAVVEAPSQAYNPFYIHSPVGLGKTHLLQAICHELLKRNPQIVIQYLPCETFLNEFIAAIQDHEVNAFRNRFRQVDVLVIDDIHFLANKEGTQEEFFHTFNTLYNSRKQIILSSDSHPKDIRDMEERLLSRFKWGLITRIDHPTFETRVSILRSKSQIRNLAISDEVLAYIAEQVTTNVRELEGAINRIHSNAVLLNRKIDLELAKEALKDSITPTSYRVSFGVIMDTVSKHFGVKSAEISSRGRTRSIARPRQVVMYLARQLAGLSLEEVGANLGRDHSTVIYGVSKIEKDIASDPGLRTLIEDLTKHLTSKR